MANRKITYEVGFTGDTSQLQAALRQAVASLQELGTRPQNLQRGLEGAAHAALELNNHLRNAYNVDTGKLDLTRFRQELDKGGKSLEDYANELRRLGPEGEQAFMQVATAIGAAELPLKRSNQLLNQLWVTMKNTARWRLTTGALNAFIGGLQQAFGYSKSLNASLNDIRIVTGKSADEMARFAKEANQAAKELSTTTTTYTDASLIYYQQGLNDQAVKERTDATIKMANVTGQSAETISSQMTAVWNNFREGSRTLKSYADTMVALGASTASSSKEIAEGLEKFAPIANSVGLSFDYASAALATLVATTRESASVAGNALKTLFSRLEGLKLGETLEDGTDLNKYSQALYTVGINIKDTNGELKDMDVILTELGNRWKDLARDEQMALAQTVGGVRQYAQLVALMDNWEVFQQNLTTARTAEGSLEKQAQIYAESWEAARDRVKAATEDVYDSLINPKVFIDLDKMAQAVLKPLASVLDAVGGLTGLLPIVAALMTKVYSAQIANVMRDMAVNIGLMTGKEQERARVIQAESAALIDSLNIREEDDVALSTKLDLMQQEIKLQAIINENVDSLTQSQVKQIENEQVILNLLKQQVLQRTEDIKKLSERRNDLSEDMASSRFNNYTQELQTTLARIRRTAFRDAKNENIVIPLKFSISKTDIDKTYDSLKTNLDEILNKYGTLLSNQERLKNFGSPVGKTAEDMREFLKSIGQYSSELEGLNRNELWEKIKILQSDAKGANISVTALRNAMAEIGIDQSHITEYIRLTEKLRAAEQLTADETERLKNLQEELGNKISQNLIKDTVDWADALVLASQAISQSAMAMRSLDNLGRIFSDETLDNRERLTQLLTTIGLLLPTIGSSVKAVTQAVAAGGLTLKTAFPILAAASVLIYGIIKVVDALHTSQKEALESIQKTTEAYKESQSDLEELNNELSTTQDRIKELQSLAESGSISIVEQEELKNLQIENDKLERQIKLREKLAEQKLKDAVREIQEKGNKAYKFTEEKVFDPAYSSSWKAASSLEQAGAIRNAVWNFSSDSSAETKSKEELIKQFEDKDWFQTNREEYISFIDDLYLAIDEAREEHHEKWKSENFETYEQLESDYLTYLEAYKKGYITEREFTDQLIRLQTARKKMYDKEGEYAESFLDPVLAQLSNQDLNTLYNTIGPVYRADLSESGQDLLDLYGISPYELQEQVLAVRDKAFSELAKFGFEDLTDKLGYVELKLIADNSFKSFEELLNYLQASSGIIPVSLQVQAIEDTRTEALAALASGELLSDELITKIQEVYQGIVDVTDFANLSVKDQIELLTTQGKIAKQQLDDLLDKEKNLQRRLDVVNNQIKNPQRYDISKETLSEKIYLDVELSNVQSEIEKLKEQVEKEPWQVNIELGDEAAATINNLKRSIDLINDDLTVSAENLVELGKRYPEVLVGAHYDANQNILQLEEEKYNQLKSLLDEAIDSTVEKNRDASAQVLTDQATIASGILAIIDETEAGKREEYRKTLIQTFDNNEKQFEDTKKMALSSMIEVVKNEIATREARLESMIEGQASSKTVTDTLAKNAEITTQNYNNAAQNILNAFDIAFRQIALGAKSVAEALAGGRDYTTIAKSVSDQNYSAERGVTLDTVYAENRAAVESSHEYQQLTREIDKLNQFVGKIEDYEAGNISWDKVKEFFDRDLPESVQRGFSDAFVKAVGIGFDTSENAVDTISALFADPEARSTIQEILNETLNTLQHLLESPETDKTKSGSGKSDLVKLDKADLDAEEQALEEIEDRYHEITREIERQERVLTKLEHQIDRTYGLDRLKLYEQQIKDLNKLQDDQRAKSARAERYLKDVDTNRLINAFQATGYSDNLSGRLSARGIGFAGSSSYDIASSIDSIGKEITNFEEVERYINQDMNNFMSAYTDFMKQYNEFVQSYEAMTDEEKQDELIQKKAEQWKLDYELLQDQFKLVEAQQKERLAAIEQYESTLDTINTLAHEIEDTARRIEDAKLNAITYRMDVILDVRDARKQIRDFSKEIAESFGDALTHGLQTASLGWDQAQDEMAMYKEYVQEYNDLKGLLDNANEFTDTTAIIDELKELEGNIIESGQRLLEWSEQVENMFVEALSAAADRFSYFTSQLEHNDAILSTIKELYALQGQTYKTQQGFERLQKVSQERLNTQVAQAKLQRQWFEQADAKLQEAQAQLDALIAEKGAEAEQDFRYDVYKKNRDALLEEQREAQKAMLSAAQEAMETTRQMYLDEIQRMSYELEQELTNGVGFDLLQDKYDHFIEEQDRYFDPIEEAMETAQWYAKLQEDIDKSSSQLQKDKLKSLQKEIDLRRENNTLSQYDLDLLEAKYKVLQASMDLEDARNTKNQLRLVRDSQGNWNYQFTTNPDDIKNQEQEMLAALQDEYEITKSRYSDLNSELLTMAQEFAEKDRQIREDMANGILTEEEGQARLAELEKYYTERASYLQKELSIAEIDLNSAALRSATLAANLSEAVYQTSSSEIQAIVDDFRDKHTPELLTQAMTSLGGPGGLQELLARHVSDFEDKSSAIKAAIMTIITADAQDGEMTGFDGLIKAIAAKDPEIYTSLETWVKTFAEQLNSENGVSGEFGKLASDLKTMIGVDKDSNGIIAAFWTLAKGADDALNGDGSVISALNTLVQNANGDASNLIESLKSIRTEGNTNLGKGTGLAKIVNDLTGSFTGDLSSMTKSIAENFVPNVEKYMDKANKKFENYGDKVKKVADDCDVSLDKLDEAVLNVAESTEEMYNAGELAVQTLWNQVTAIWDAQMGYVELEQAVWNYIYALQALADEKVVSTIEDASGVDTFDNVDNGYSYSGDLSQKMAQSWYNYSILGIKDALDDFNDFVEERHAATEKAGIKDDTDEIIQTIKEATADTLEQMADKKIKITISLNKEDAEKAVAVTGQATEYKEGYSFATGGYTGTWGDDGRLAFLHEKELVLNAQDTENLLSAVSLVRSMDDIFGNIAEQLDSDGFAAMALLGQRMGGIGLPAAANSDLEQHVTIEHVSFPGVTSSREIEEAFENLVNDAAQWARRRKS